MDLASVLKSNGFSENESSIYLALVESGDSVASVIAKRTEMNRTTCYVTLKKLVQKGVVRSYSKRKIQYFTAKDPKYLVEDIQARAEKMAKALPELEALKLIGNKSQAKVEFFEGVDGLVEIMKDTLTCKSKKIYGWVNAEEATDRLAHYYPEYIREKNKRSIQVHGVFNYGPMALRFKKWGEVELREIYLLPEGEFPFQNEVNIYDDNMMIISHSDAVGVIIRSKTIADTFKSVFEITMKYAKSNEHNVLTTEDIAYLESEVPYVELFSA